MPAKRILKTKCLAYMRGLLTFDQEVDEITLRRTCHGDTPSMSARDAADTIETIQTRFTMLGEAGVDSALLEVGRLFRRYLEIDRKKYELENKHDSDQSAYYAETLSAKGILSGVLGAMFGDREGERADARRVAGLNRKAGKIDTLIEQRNELAHRFGVKMRAIQEAYREKGWLK